MQRHGRRLGTERPRWKNNIGGEGLGGSLGGRRVLHRAKAQTSIWHQKAMLEKVTVWGVLGVGGGEFEGMGHEP